MGASRRPQPKHLARKLYLIRAGLNLTQEQMAEKLREAPSPPRPADIARFELGIREPSLPVLLYYARCVGVLVDTLVDDELSLPQKLQKQSAIKRKRSES
jgi:transcriptional regulator with XRE-family HTH domain